MFPAWCVHTYTLLVSTYVNPLHLIPRSSALCQPVDISSITDKGTIQNVFQDTYKVSRAVQRVLHDMWNKVLGKFI